MSTLQKHIRCDYYQLPIHCGYCGHRIVNEENDDEPIIEPCPHTLYVALSDGVFYLADRVVSQLQENGYEVTSSETVEGLMDVLRDDSEDPDVLPEELADIMDLTEGIVIEAHVGANPGMSTYVAYAPLEGE